MKFCGNCGHKIIASDGRVVKFCPECGTNLSGGVASSSSQVVEVEASDDFNVSGEDFYIEGSNETKVTFDSIASSQSTGENLPKRANSSSLEDLQAKMKSNKPLEA